MSKVQNKSYLDDAVKPFDFNTAMEEAKRCLMCHDSPCSKGCPAGTNPGKFIRSLRFGNLTGAVRTIRENNVLGGCCASVCPYDQLCENNCSRARIDKPIEIGRLQKFIIEQEKIMGIETLQAPIPTKSKVACIGGGPASLTCAASLAMEGYKVTIFEEREKAGGVMSYGIVPARLSQTTVDYDIEKIKNLGVKFRFNTKIGKDITIDKLKEDGFEAIFLGIGLWNSKIVDIPGSDLLGVINALDFLESARRNDGNINVGDDVIIIGGGNVAMDCAATAKLAGARNVNILYRRTVEDAPAEIKEIQYVQSMGVNMITKFQPKEIVGIDGKVLSLLAEGTDEYSELKIKADTIVYAIGQNPENVKCIADVNLTERGLIFVNESKVMTSDDGLFAAGDIVNGGKTVVEAVEQGKIVAESIIEYLSKRIDDYKKSR